MDRVAVYESKRHLPFHIQAVPVQGEQYFILLNDKRNKTLASEIYDWEIAANLAWRWNFFFPLLEELMRIEEKQPGTVSPSIIRGMHL